MCVWHWSQHPNRIFSESPSCLPVYSQDALKVYFFLRIDILVLQVFSVTIMKNSTVFLAFIVAVEMSNVHLIFAPWIIICLFFFFLNGCSLDLYPLFLVFCNFTMMFLSGCYFILFLKISYCLGPEQFLEPIDCCLLSLLEHFVILSSNIFSFPFSRTSF